MSDSDHIARIRSVLSLPGEGSSDFDLTPEVKLPAGRKLRPAAVLMPFLYEQGELRLLLTKRSSALKHHPGQIAFPGGKLEDHDSGPVAAALREAEEEIGLSRNDVEPLGILPAHETVTSFTVTPVLGLIKRPFQPLPDKNEVEEVFAVPFGHVSDLRNFQRQGRIWQGKVRRYETVPFGPYYIWGATARMLRALAERLAS